MESKKVKLGIIDYDVSQTSLDQVFMQMARAQKFETAGEEQKPETVTGIEEPLLQFNPAAGAPDLR